MKPVFRIFMLATALSSVAFVNGQEEKENYHSSSIEAQSILPIGQFASRYVGGGYAKLGFGVGYTSRFHYTKGNVGYFFDARLNYQRNSIATEEAINEEYIAEFQIETNGGHYSMLNSSFGFGVQVPIERFRLSASTGFGICGGLVRVNEITVNNFYGSSEKSDPMEAYFVGTSFYSLLEFGIPLKKDKSYLSFYTDLRVQNIRDTETFAKPESSVGTISSLGLGMKFTYCFGQD
ncbi:MAG: hypothetical protein EP332_15235 [Bacteroidetes bacterium]|nr:MAG: hypothetical protein EP332_15235 [Bacteroidota bacterium]